MNRNVLLSGVVAAAVLLGAGGMAQAQIITFDAHGPDFGRPILDSGFTFDPVAAGWGVFGPGSGACCNINYDGTAALYADGDRDGHAYLVMTPTAGGTFNVSALDAATYWNGATGTVNLYGALHGGGSVSIDLNITDSFQHFSLSGFTNLDSLTFSDSQSGAFLTAPGFGVDNINLGAAVPEPAAWALMITGFGLAGVALRRRRSLAVA